MHNAPRLPPAAQTLPLDLTELSRVQVWEALQPNRSMNEVLSLTV
jgi:hypothetical protein